ncbi:MAG: TROVE domain-containing protein [Deltaproteobacteria bacterium]|nr:TROVE domain-containing protein [Deltaproteobacteria bacterium]
MSRKALAMFGASARSVSAPIRNHDGYPAWERPLEERYLQALLCNTLGNTFYASASNLLAETRAVHAEMMLGDTAFAAKAIMYARMRGLMRTQPVYGLASLAGTDLARFREAFDRVVLTPADLADFTTMVKAQRRGEGGRAIKSIAGRRLLRLDEYRVIKYGAERADGGYALRDLFRVHHPRAGRRLPLVDYLLGRADAAALAALPQIRALEDLKRATTDEAKVEAITRGRLPVEVASSFAGSSRAVWSAIVPQLPMLALVRHLATLERHGVLDEHRALLESRFGDARAVQRSRVLPFRFLEASRHVKSAWARDALRDALEHAFGAVPSLHGRTVVCLDRSGSMGAYIQQAAIFALCALKKARGDGRLLLFDDRLDELALSLRDSVLSQAESIRVRGGTNHTLAVDELLRTRERVDSLVYVTDEQQNTGSPLLDRLDVYRRKVNADVKVFIVNVAPYVQSVAPPHEKKTFHVFGWSDAVLSFLAMASRGFGSLVDVVRSGAWDVEVN